MTSLTTHILANPRGRKYSYAVKIRGFPYLWTDGKANWTAGGVREVIHGGLGMSDWSLDFKSDPLSPLEVGSGLNIVLVDEPSRRTRYLFSPDRSPDFRSFLVVADTTGWSPNDTTAVVQSTTGVTDDMDLYIGLETVTVTNVDSATDLTVTRGAWGSLAYRHASRYDGLAAGTRGVEVSSLPTVWRGRFVEIFMAPVEADGTAGTQYPIWAGRIGSFTLTGKSIRISCDPLTASLAKDDWPDPLPAGGTGTDTFNIYLTEENMYIVLDASSASAGGGASNTGIRAELGIYNAAGTFVEWSTPGWYTLEQIAQALTDTIIHACYGTGDAGSPSDDAMVNAFSIYVGEISGTYDRGIAEGQGYNKLTLSWRNESEISVMLHREGIIAKLEPRNAGATPFAILRRSVGQIMILSRSGFLIDKYASQIVLYPDDRRDIPTTQGCWHNDGDEMRGYVKITDGTNVELVGFNASALGSMGEVYLSVTERGLGGTTARAWGQAEDDTSAAPAVRIEQVMVVTSGEPMPLAKFILYLLLSVDGETSNNSVYDKLGSRFGLAIHEDFVDYDAILANTRIADMQRPCLWWVEQSGKGKDAIEQLLKMHGVYLVTRRFERDGVQRFGISVDVVDVPTPTRYNVALGDNMRLADTSPEVDINERLVINTITIVPRYRFGDKEGEIGGKRHVYAEDSINKFGASKALEIKANALFSSFTGSFVSPVITDDGVATAVATSIALRWFGAYADGNFTLELESPHVGWAIQAGDRVLLNLTGVPNPNGDDGFDNTTCKVYDVKHVHGKKASAKHVFRISLARAAELAPCFRITDASTEAVTISTNEFSDAGALPPFNGDTSPNRDIYWFDNDKHSDGAGLRVRIWVEGDFAGTVVERTVVSRALTSNRLVLNSSLGGVFTSAISGGSKVIGTFIDYDDPTELMARYAYIGDNGIVSLVGTADASTDDVEAFEWV